MAEQQRRVLQNSKRKPGNGSEKVSRAAPLGATRDHKGTAKGKGKIGDGAARGRGQRSGAAPGDGGAREKKKTFSALFDKKLDPVRVH